MDKKIIKKNKDFIEELEKRGILNNFLNKDEFLKTNVAGKKFYLGIDPTANFLHLGHLALINLAKLLEKKLGMIPIYLVGDFTSRMGDPSGKKQDRESEIIKKEKRDILMKSIKNVKLNEIEEFHKKHWNKVLDNENKVGIVSSLKNQINIPNERIHYNSKHFDGKNINLFTFFDVIGKSTNLIEMLNRKSVKERLKQKNGISYTEFSYQIFQAFDFLSLHLNEEVILQIGGADQWGNILQGMLFIKEWIPKDDKVFGITINLLTSSTGEKLGKSTLDSNGFKIDESLSKYKIYQYFFNLSDDDALSTINQLTTIDSNKVDKLYDKHKKDPSQRIIQKEIIKYYLDFFSKKNDSEEQFKNLELLSKFLFSSKTNEKYEKNLEKFDSRNFKYLPIVKDFYKKHDHFMKSIQKDKSLNYPKKRINLRDHFFKLLFNDNIKISSPAKGESNEKKSFDFSFNKDNLDNISINGNLLSEKNFNEVINEVFNKDDFAILKIGKKDFYLLKK